MAELHIELLGGLRVRTGAGRELRVVSRKAQALLGCLALQPGVPHSRDMLAGLLWEDSDPELARASLRQALASLRRSLPESCATALRGDAGTVMLDADLASSDVEQFRTLIRNGSPGALARAVERHAGVLLDGFEARSPAFDQWLMERRGELRRLLIAAAGRMAAQCTASGDDAGAIAALERLVGIEPSNERAQRDLMEALARQGRYTDALRQYRACREALRRDLDVAPESATEALHRELMRRRRAVAADDASIDVRVETPAAVDTTPPGGLVARSEGRDRGAETTLREAVILVARIGDVGDAADDPEAVRSALTAAHMRVASVVERHGGRVDRPTGGETLAAFGLGAVAGNEVDHAIRAAIELAAVNESGPEGCPWLALGVAQGQVLPASGASPFPLSGRPVAEARELARAAAAGEVAAASDVASQVSARYSVTALAGDVPAGAHRVIALPATEARPTRPVFYRPARRARHAPDPDRACLRHRARSRGDPARRSGHRQILVDRGARRLRRARETRSSTPCRCSTSARQ